MLCVIRWWVRVYCVVQHRNARVVPLCSNEKENITTVRFHLTQKRRAEVTKKKYMKCSHSHSPAMLYYSNGSCFCLARMFAVWSVRRRNEYMNRNRKIKIIIDIPVRCNRIETTKFNNSTVKMDLDRPLVQLPQHTTFTYSKPAPMMMTDPFTIYKRHQSTTSSNNQLYRKSSWRKHETVADLNRVIYKLRGRNSSGCDYYIHVTHIRNVLGEKQILLYIRKRDRQRRPRRHRFVFNTRPIRV